MISRRKTTDRRLRPRFEVVGDLWGTLEVVHPMPVVNIATGGALIESERVWEVGAVHAIAVANGTEVGRAQVCVRHVTAVDGPGGRRFLIGVEFLSISPGLAGQIEQWVALGGDAARDQRDGGYAD